MSRKRPEDADKLRKGQLNAQRAAESMQSATLEIIADVPALLLGHRLDVLATTTWLAP